MYHFIGIKGTGMSSLAVMMKQLGYSVKGSDIAKHFFTEEELIKKDLIPLTDVNKGLLEEYYKFLTEENSPKLNRKIS